MRLLLILVSFALTASSAELNLLIGTHAEGGSEGAYSVTFDDEKGSFTSLKLISNYPGTGIVHSGEAGVYYSSGGSDEGGVLKSFLNGKETGIVKGFPNQPCYISTDKTANFAFTANIKGNSISSFSLNKDGSLNKLVQTLEIKPLGKKFAAHCVIPSPDNKFLFVADIAGRRMCRVLFNVEDGSLKYDGDVRSKNFIGPRHLIFGPEGKFAYLMNQMGGAVSVFKYKNGDMSEIQHISSLPKYFKGKNHSAEILIHPNGKFLYCSNRGPNSLSLFKRNLANGKLELVEVVASGGESPWSFSLTPNGKYLLCSNKNSANIAVFTINQEDGSLSASGIELKVPAPVSVEFVNK